MISPHAPLFSSTRHMIDEQSIARMKDTVILVNTARGGLIDMEALQAIAVVTMENARNFNEGNDYGNAEVKA